MLSCTQIEPSGSSRMAPASRDPAKSNETIRRMSYRRDRGRLYAFLLYVYNSQ